MRERIDFGPSPTITFLYGEIGRGARKSYAIFHYDNVAYLRSPEHVPFSLNQMRALNQAATLQGTDESWIEPLFSGI